MTQKTTDRRILFLKDGSAWVDHICVTSDGCAFYTPETPAKKNITGQLVAPLPSQVTMDVLAAEVKAILDRHTAATEEIKRILKNSVRGRE